MRTIAEAGGDVSRFVWIHAHNEPDLAIHDELAAQGVWLEYDGIGEPADDPRFIDLVLRALDRGMEDRVLLSQDRGWYDPAKPGGGTPMPYTALPERFVPLMRESGIDEATVSLLVRENPFRAFAR